MKISQELSSNVIIEQDFKTSARFVMFETGYEGWEYATDGGTLFVVNLGGKLLALTCGHVLKDFDPKTLCVTNARFGTHVAGFQALRRIKAATPDATETEATDVVVVELSDVDPVFFTDPAYVIDAGTIAQSREGDRLIVYGTLKAESEITDQLIKPVFAELEVLDQGLSSFDPTLRKAGGSFANPEFSAVTGLSGAPVFNKASGKLCGMVTRGNMTGTECTLWYVDMVDVSQFLAAIAEGRDNIFYLKPLSGGPRS